MYNGTRVFRFTYFEIPFLDVCLYLSLCLFYTATTAVRARSFPQLRELCMAASTNKQNWAK